MCTMLLLGLAGTAVSAVGAISQGQQANAAAKAQAAALEQQAEAERKSAGFEMLQKQRQQELAQSAARAAVGASGVGFAGSPTSVLAANAGQDQLDLEAIQYGSQLKQNNLNTQADIARFQGKQAQTASFINAGSSIVSGATSIYKNSIKMGTPSYNAFAYGGGYAGLF